VLEPDETRPNAQHDEGAEDQQVQRATANVAPNTGLAEHVHHQLLDFGLSQRETCVVFYAATGVTSGLGLMLYGHKKIIAVAVVLLIVAVSTLLGERLSEMETGTAGDSGALLES